MHGTWKNKSGLLATVVEATANKVVFTFFGDGDTMTMNKEDFMSAFEYVDREYIFTFGTGQQHEGGFHAIQAGSAQAARDMMFQKFGSAWSMQYDAPNAREKAGVDRWNLKEIK